MKNKLILGIMLVVLTTGVYAYPGFNLGGWYEGGVIKIWVNRLHSQTEYFHVAAHEYAHWVYNQEMNKTEIAEWDKLIEEHGLESGYPFDTSTTDASDEQEEFCECYAHFVMQRYDECHADKNMFIAQIWQRMG